jgi:chaperonin GroEL
MENPLILLANSKVNSVQQVLKFLEHAMQAQRPLLLITEEVESEPLTTLILNRLKGNLKICCVKSPAFGDNRKNQMEDIAILTNGTVLDAEVGLTFENGTEDILGSAKKVIITKDGTTIIGGEGDAETIQRRVDQINGQKEVSVLIPTNPILT